MASLTINVSDSLVAPLLSALHWKYPDIELEGLTLAQQGRKFIRRMLVDVWVEYKTHLAVMEANSAFIKAQTDAKAVAEALAETEIT